MRFCVGNCTCPGCATPRVTRSCSCTLRPSAQDEPWRTLDGCSVNGQKHMKTLRIERMLLNGNCDLVISAEIMTARSSIRDFSNSSQTCSLVFIELLAFILRLLGFPSTPPFSWALPSRKTHCNGSVKLTTSGRFETEMDSSFYQNKSDWIKKFRYVKCSGLFFLFVFLALEKLCWKYWKNVVSSINTIINYIKLINNQSTTIL